METRGKSSLSLFFHLSAQESLQVMSPQWNRKILKSPLSVRRRQSSLSLCETNLCPSIETSHRHLSTTDENLSDEDAWMPILDLVYAEVRVIFTPSPPLFSLSLVGST